MPQDFTYIWNLRNKANEQKGKGDKGKQREQIWLPEGKWGDG